MRAADYDIKKRGEQRKIFARPAHIKNYLREKIRDLPLDKSLSWCYNKITKRVTPKRLALNVIKNNRQNYHIMDGYFLCELL